jgi:predicted transcriptional regulator
MVNTRTSSRGRTPKLRDEILYTLAQNRLPMSLKEIAIHLNKDETTPYRPLKDLQLMGLVNSDTTGEVITYAINLAKYEQILNQS